MGMIADQVGPRGFPARVLVGKLADRDPQSSGPLTPRSAEDPAEHAADDLAADLTAHGARGLLRHRLHHALTALVAPEDLAHLGAEAGAFLRGRLFRRGARSDGGAGAGDGASLGRAGGASVDTLRLLKVS